MAARNTFKLKTGRSGKNSLFKRMEGALNMDSIFEDGLPVKYLPHMLFVVALTLVYIGNSHYAEKNARRISTLEKRVEDLRADYHTLKSDYMVNRMQSEVARKVKPMGLVESQTPPFKVVVPPKK